MGSPPATAIEAAAEALTNVWLLYQEALAMASEIETYKAEQEERAEKAAAEAAAERQGREAFMRRYAAERALAMRRYAAERVLADRLAEALREAHPADAPTGRSLRRDAALAAWEEAHGLLES